MTVLGCAGSSYDPMLQHPCSSYLLESGVGALLLDCGYGSFDSYQALTPETRLDAIFVSHAHRDHVADLEQFMTTSDIWREAPRLIASEETMAVIVPTPHILPAEMLVLMGDAQQFQLENFILEFSTTTHQMPTLAVCVSFGARRVVYSGDTGSSWVFPPPFVGADVALVECTLGHREHGDSPYHLDAQEMSVLARELAAKRTVITHVPPGESGSLRLESARRHEPDREFLLATTGLTLTFN
jgi:ribonuclease BN (tRNA processing enzyme)